MSDRILCGREIRGVARVLPPHLDQERIAHDAGLPAPLVEIPYSLCDEEASRRFWRAIMSRTDDLSLPFQLGLLLPDGTYDVVDYLTFCAADVRQVFFALARVFPLVTSDFRWDIDDDASTVSLVKADSVAPEQAVCIAQFIFGVVFGRLHARVATGLRYLNVSLATPPLPHQRYTTAFGVVPHFRVERPQVGLSPASWRTPLVTANTGLFEVLDRHATLLLDRLPRAQDAITRIRAAVNDQLLEGSPSLERVGRAVGMSSRTLQRRLREQGTTFAALVDEERASAARTLLADPKLDIGEVADRVGYSEPSAFVRAFRRWAHCTPSEFRNLTTSGGRGVAA